MSDTEALREAAKKIRELAEELDSELSTGVKWSRTQHTCASVSGALGDVVRSLDALAALLAADKAGGEAVAHVKGDPLRLEWVAHPVLGPLYTHPQPQLSALPDDVVKDAERYRWLASEAFVNLGEWCHTYNLAQKAWGLSQYIDAAMLKEKP